MQIGLIAQTDIRTSGAYPAVKRLADPREPAVWRYAASAVESAYINAGRPTIRQAAVVHEQSMTDQDQEFLFYRGDDARSGSVVHC
jgi:hypothetical protein